MIIYFRKVFRLCFSFKVSECLYSEFQTVEVISQGSWAPEVPRVRRFTGPRGSGSSWDPEVLGVTGSRRSRRWQESRGPRTGSHFSTMPIFGVRILYSWRFHLPWRIHILNPKNSRVIYLWSLFFFLKSRLLFNIFYFSTCFWTNIYISRVRMSQM